MNTAIIYFVASFVTTWLVIRFGENIPLLGLPETGWVKSFFWTIMILVAGYAIGTLMTSVFA